MNETHDNRLGDRGDSASPESPFSYGRLCTEPTVLGRSARLLLHAERHEAARARVQAATQALRDDPCSRTRAEARDALAAYKKAEARLARSRWRMKQSIEDEMTARGEAEGGS
jgi:hypothetical protein